MTKSDTLSPGEWAVDRSASGGMVATNGLASVVLYPSNGEPHEIFHRNFKKMTMGRGGEKVAAHARWLVAELDGVRLYTDGVKYILTKKDLYF